MSAEPPSPWEQACPRSVRLAPEGHLVPSATLAVLLRGGRRLPLLYAGHGLEPWIHDAQTIVVDGGVDPWPGALVLCDRAGWGDLLRAVAPAPGGWVTMLDAFPTRRLFVRNTALLGIVIDPRVGRLASSAARLACLTGLGALQFAWRRIACAPAWGDDAGASVFEKYRGQVASYQEHRGSNLDDAHKAAIARHAPRQGAVLVGGCGAGGEVVDLARAGYRVTGVDGLPEMIHAARTVARQEGIEARFVIGDLCDTDIRDRYHVIYLTPLLYSFVAGRERRVGLLRRLGRHLQPGGAVLYSAQMHGGVWSWIETRAAWCRRAMDGSEGEPGDWYTWYPTPGGTLGYSYLRRFMPGELLAEARVAGFGSVERLRSHILATRPAGA
jgi:SAM-dependent methyltransferase